MEIDRGHENGEMMCGEEEHMCVTRANKLRVRILVEDTVEMIIDEAGIEK